MTLWFDLKYAWRLLLKSWGYSLMCAVVVALSVGLAVWTYTLFYSQLLKPLPFPNSHRWHSVQVGADATSRPRATVDAYTWQELRKHVRPGVLAGAVSNRSAVLSEGEATTSLRGAAITPSLLKAMGVAPILGRTFEATDGHAEARAVAMLSHDTWQQYFAGDPSIIGKTARINATPMQIVGVMPRDFLVIDDYEVWLPLQLPQLARPGDSDMTMYPLIVLDEGQSPTPIVNEMNRAIVSVNRAWPRLFHAERHVAIIPASKMFTHGVSTVLTMISLMAAGVLLLGCVNISMVFLARLLERSRELALRSALGSSRGRLMRQCLLESALIVVVGLVAGYALAFLGVEWTHSIDSFGSRILAGGRSTNLPEMRPVDILVAVLFAIVVWLLSTLVPAWRVARQDAAVVLAGSGKGANVRGSNRSVGLLVGLQVVISCLVLVSCGNVVVALKRELNKPSGLETAQLLISTNPTVFDARYADAPRRLRYWEELEAAMESKVPGSDVAFSTASPTRPIRVAAAIEARQGSDKQGALMLPVTTVSENYFPLLGIGLRSGRLFDSTDNADSLAVAIVDEKMAVRYWPGEDAVGKRVQLNGDDARWLTIVGVVSNVRGAPYRTDADLGTLYQPLRQVVPPSFQALIRVPSTTTDHRPALRAAAYAVDRDLPLHNLQRFDDYMTALTQGLSAMSVVFVGIAVITAVLAASGLFGLISRSVAQRTQEVGIRRALGATTWRATSMFRREGTIYLSVAVAGLALGVLITPLLSKAFPNILERVVPVTLGVVLLMAAVISTASYLPTRRAVALDPSDALRYE